MTKRTRTKALRAQFTYADISQMWHTSSQYHPSFDAFADPMRFEIPQNDDIDWEPSTKDAMFWCGDRFLEAKLIRDFHRLNERKAVILWDMSDPEDPEFCVIVKDWSLR